MGPHGLVEETKEINTLSTASAVPCEGGCAHAALHAPEQEQNVSLTKSSSSSILSFSECPQHIQRMEKNNTANSMGSSLTWATGNGINSTEDGRSISDV